MLQRIQKIHATPWFDRNKYTIITASVLFLLLAPPILSPYLPRPIIQGIGYAVLTFSSQALVALSSKKAIWLSSGWLIIILNSIASIVENEPIWVGYIIYILMIIYYSNITVRLLEQIWKKKDVNVDVIIGSFAGYLLIGILGFFILMLCEMAYPGSFNIVHEADIREDNYIGDLLYFTYVNLSTVGYGEITPQLPLAKRLCVMLGMIGPFYLSSFAGFIIAKYINSKNTKEHPKH